MLHSFLLLYHFTPSGLFFFPFHGCPLVNQNSAFLIQHGVNAHLQIFQGVISSAHIVSTVLVQQSVLL